MTLTNTGTLVLPISSITDNSTAFVVSHTCGSSVAVGASCTISVVLKPTTAGAKSGTLTVTGGNGAGAKTVALSGTAIVPLFTLAPARSGSASRRWAGPRRRRMVTLTNTGTLVLPISSITDNSTAFVVSHTCGSSVAVGASCTISAVLKPTTGGAKSGTLTVTGGNGAGAKTVALSGTAIL